MNKRFFIQFVGLVFTFVMYSESTYGGDVSVPYEAQAISLLDRCKKIEKLDVDSANNADLMDINFCSGYISGVTETLNTIRYLDKKSLKTLPCLPKDASIKQYAAILQKSAEDSPEILNSPRNLFVVPALSVMYPCVPQ